MLVKIIGKDEALKNLEKAQKLIKEAESILYRLPMELGLELEADSEQDTIAVQDTQ